MLSSSLSKVRHASKFGLPRGAFVSNRFAPTVTAYRNFLTINTSFSDFPISKRNTSRFLSTDDLSVTPPTSNHKFTPSPHTKGSIIYTETDEAPALATFSFLPVLSKVRIRFDPRQLNQIFVVVRNKIGLSLY